MPIEDVLTKRMIFAIPTSFLNLPSGVDANVVASWHQYARKSALYQYAHEPHNAFYSEALQNTSLCSRCIGIAYLLVKPMLRQIDFTNLLYQTVEVFYCKNTGPTFFKYSSSMA